MTENGRRYPIIRTVPQPGDVNGNGDVFGGWIMSHMDIAGGILASRRAHSRVVTVAVDSMSFLRPVNVGDVVSIYGEVTAVGRTSITVHMETMVQRRDEPEALQVTEGKYIYVAINEDGSSIPVDRT